MNKFLHHIYNSRETGLTINTYIDKECFGHERRAANHAHRNGQIDRFYARFYYGMLLHSTDTTVITDKNGRLV